MTLDKFVDILPPHPQTARSAGGAGENQTADPFYTLSWQNRSAYFVEESDSKAFQALFSVIYLSFVNYPG
ncbi:MAG: hypothetical protein ACKO63_05130 [Nodosilinea sp.]